MPRLRALDSGLRHEYFRVMRKSHNVYALECPLGVQVSECRRTADRGIIYSRMQASYAIQRARVRMNVARRLVRLTPLRIDSLLDLNPLERVGSRVSRG